MSWVDPGVLSAPPPPPGFTASAGPIDVCELWLRSTAPGFVGPRINLLKEQASVRGCMNDRFIATFFRERAGLAPRRAPYNVISFAETRDRIWNCGEVWFRYSPHKSPPTPNIWFSCFLLALIEQPPEIK